MPCDRKLKAGQKITERKAEIRAAIGRLERGLATGAIKSIVGPQGAIAFTPWSNDGVTDACAYRRLLVGGSSLAKVAIARAEQMAGRPVALQVIGEGVHSHDGGKTWHGKG